ncbi:MAG: zinc ABC transporter substrate-binding protein [Candidatus ainarchaeum sp.]|jgi:zinc transport system substrate-binding protein|nr:zinc ABC transporter substrate-binding protein [Candidatus ainarchaeum sp.]
MNFRFILILCLVFSFLLFNGCTTPQFRENKTNKLTIVTTIFPLYEFSREIGQDKVNVILLIPPGLEPHTFEPKPSDIKTISNSDLFVYVGEGMEPWAHDLFEGINPNNSTLFKASNYAKLIHNQDKGEEQEDEKHNEYEEQKEEIEEYHHPEEYDPHIWLDFSNDVRIVQELTKIINEIDQNNSQYYLTNAENYIKLLEDLDKNYFNELSNCNHKEFISGGHNAFGYLANRYDLNSIAISGLSPNSEPTPQKMKTIIELTKAKGIQYIYFEELLNSSIATTIAQETGTQTLKLNPAGNLSKKEFDDKITFIDIMKANLESLKIGLECN